MLMRAVRIDAGIDDGIDDGTTVGVVRRYIHSYHCPDLPSGFRGCGTALFGNSGLMIVSKTPILRGAYHRFNKQAAFELHCVDRGALFAEVEGPEPGTKLQVFTAHMASGGMVVLAGLHLPPAVQDALTGQGNGTGVQQAHELTAFVKEHANPSVPPEPGVVTIVAGDLNMRPFHPEYAVVAAGMKELGLVDAYDGVWEPTFGTVDEHGSPHERLMTHRADYGTCKELDYVFSSGAKVVDRQIDRCVEKDASAGWQQVSDHAAIVVTFEL